MGEFVNSVYMVCVCVLGTRSMLKWRGNVFNVAAVDKLTRLSELHRGFRVVGRNLSNV